MLPIMEINSLLAHIGESTLYDPETDMFCLIGENKVVRIKTREQVVELLLRELPKMIGARDVSDASVVKALPGKQEPASSRYRSQGGRDNYLLLRRARYLAGQWGWRVLISRAEIGPYNAGGLRVTNANGEVQFDSGTFNLSAQDVYDLLDIELCRRAAVARIGKVE